MLAGEASWVLDFTSEIDIVLATINSLQVVPGSSPSEPFEFDKLTALLMQVRAVANASASFQNMFPLTRLLSCIRPSRRNYPREYSHRLLRTTIRTTI